ncbi:fimbria/pilus periplasmic chaperone [Desulfobotulus sp. H1]|uniref:Fimbria/pilus periplasmic chaperone n=1 Tax=Desulfobotulus pelophilus TaxID=2823377 RepID=A0ABT3N9P7_9BACT|nr:fimbria/pilus periplasmic chaperone [Desulfobotulus pelophilus]MCW7753901.1 fimbria/pilus periplasmic chaperone [Desulfobotulus pelophilus]
MRVFLSFLVFACINAFSLPSQASETAVILSPLRMVLEGRDRSETLRIVNPNSVPVTYRIEMVVMEQDTDGNVREVGKTKEHEDLLRMVRFSPRQVRLEPGAMQAVRIMLRKPATLQDGEYRVHVRVSPLPEPDRNMAEVVQAKAGQTTININFLVSTSIPLIIRHGKTAVNIDARGIELGVSHGETPVLQTLIFGEGNRSIYMDGAIFYGKILLGEVKGFAVYQPNGKRYVRFPLQADLPPSGSTLRLVLRDREKEGNPLIKEIPLVLNY